MVFLRPITVAALVATLTSATPALDSHKSPRCSADTYNVPCLCPNGTTFRNLTTFGVIGAPAIEVQQIIDNCMDNIQEFFVLYIRTLHLTRLFSFQLFLAGRTRTIQDNREPRHSRCYSHLQLHNGEQLLLFYRDCKVLFSSWLCECSLATAHGARNLSRWLFRVRVWAKQWVANNAILID